MDKPNLVKDYEAARKFAEAIEHYDKFMEIGKDAFDHWDTYQALVGWEEELEGEPTANDLVRLGKLYLEMSHYDDDKKCYEDALALDANCNDTHGHLELWHTPRGSPRSAFGFTARPSGTWRRARTAQISKTRSPTTRVDGALRNLWHAARGGRRNAGKLSSAKQHTEAARLYLKEAAREDLSPGTKLYCLAYAGQAMTRAGDTEGAWIAFARVLQLTLCKATT